MGFMDKARKLAEQAQEKLDEVQAQRNQSGHEDEAAASQGPVVEYDQHGRPIPAAEAGASTPPPAGPPPPAPPVATDAPSAAPPEQFAPPAPPSAAAPPPPAPAGDAPVAGASFDVDRSDQKPPEITSGDPLAG